MTQAIAELNPKTNDESGTAVPIPDELIPGLNEAEQAELRRCEETIKQHLETFVQVGEALATIRDLRLYRAEFGTFNDYCAAKWGFTARRARQIWTAAEAFRVITGNKFEVLPTTESQLRPLSGLDPREQLSIWQESIVEAETQNKRLTGDLVRAVITRRRQKGTAVPVLQILNAHQEGQPGEQLVQLPPSMRTPVDPPRNTPMDAGTKQERIMAQLKAALAEVRGLRDELGTADSTAVGELPQAIQILENVKDHVERKNTRLSR